MNNLGTISRIVKHIEKEFPQYKGAMVEVTLNSTQESTKSRLMYILGYEDETLQTLRPMIEAAILGQGYECEFDFKQSMYDFVRKYSLSNRPSIEANWRGRLFYYRDLEQDQNKSDFLLKSVWRIIVTQDAAGKFFTRHDINPVFWSPGFSIAGQDTFADEVSRILESLQSRRKLLLDEENDFIKVFAKRNGLGAYSTVPLTPPGQEEVYEYRLSDINNLNQLRDILVDRIDDCFR
jgi:hypothetical protein